MKLVSQLEEAGIDVEDVTLDAEEAYFNCKSYENEMPKVLVILFYSTLELKLKKILSELTSLDKKAILDFDFCEIKESFTNELKIDFTKLSSFSEFNELRRINNCLKHSGIVNDKLQKANKTRWKEGEPIILTKEDLDRVLTKSKKFFTNLLNNLANMGE